MPITFSCSCTCNANSSPLGKIIEIFPFCWETYGSSSVVNAFHATRILNFHVPETSLNAVLTEKASNLLENGLPLTEKATNLLYYSSSGLLPTEKAGNSLLLTEKASNLLCLAYCRLRTMIGHPLPNQPCMGNEAQNGARLNIAFVGFVVYTHCALKRETLSGSARDRQPHRPAQMATAWSTF